MTDYCILNGELADAGKGCISPYDRGLMYGDGVFDTMYAPKGVPFLFVEHMKRLSDNLKSIGVTLPYTIDELKAMVGRLIEVRRLAGLDAYVRTTVTRGINRGGMYYESSEPTLIIIAGRVADNLTEIRERGRRCVISEVPKLVPNPQNEIKSLNFMWSILAMRAAHESGADEVLFFNSTGHLSEGSTSNVFIVKDKAIKTPPDDAGLLCGVTRDYLIRLLLDNGITVKKQDITMDELMASDEIFLTSSVAGVVPVSHLQGRDLVSVSVKEIQGMYFNNL